MQVLASALAQALVLVGMGEQERGGGVVRLGDGVVVGAAN